MEELSIFVFMNIVGSENRLFVFNNIVGCTFIFDISFSDLGAGRLKPGAEKNSSVARNVWASGAEVTVAISHLRC
jgi:hypothetical protein